MIYGYIRVSTDKQTVENQRYEILKFCETKNFIVDGWIEETISGTKDPKKRKLGKLLSQIQEGDVIICSELSRLGRSLFMVMEILSYCMEHNCKIYTIKDNFVLGDDISSKVLAFAFSLAAEIERNMISERTKVALEAKKAAGVKLGRPKGALGKNTKLTPYENSIRQLIAEQGNNYSVVARLFHVDRTTLKRFCDNHEIYPPQYKEDGGIIFNMPKINN